MIKKALAIIVGSLFVALGVNLFVIPHHLLDGGILGIGLIAKYLFGVKAGFTIIIISLPLYIFSFFYFREYFYNGLHGLFVSSLLIDLLHPLTSWNIDGGSILFSVIAGGICIGSGVGIMLLNDISTGASDLLALMLSKVTSINAGIIIFLIDCFVLIVGWFAITEVNFLYSAIMVIIVGLTTSGIIRKFT
ncbi:YitT family protein [Oceanobacillus bengalensis]|uniref:YitT family protein n=1 Tax=Oceanobacillus bengalensis TaxID=1435466 RepID=A0A494YXV6_9BACI|nr:YitT family protein [Oceanobacillus bengalensis]RKQ15000.1 hypothetical protein D8M05_11105 [Oceanobacillus bengalensis]